MNNVSRRVLAVCLALCLLLTGIPIPAPVGAAAPKTLSLQNGNIEVTVSTVNGGFAVRTLEGDVLNKDDNNRDLLFRRDAFDTSFASFSVRDEPSGPTTTYVFGNDYSYLGWSTNLDVQRVATGIRAVWTVKDLVFTQLLEPVSNEQSNEHGTVRISYSVRNNSGKQISVAARLLLDTALGAQDYAYYELAQPPTAGDPFVCVEREQLLSREKDYLPANFFAYDNYLNPTIAAYTIFDQAEGAVAPDAIAFGHWNNLAATAFDFSPDEGLTFTNPYNRKYLTADSAFALYYQLGAVADGAQSQAASTYYGVDSKVRVKDGDRVGVTVTAPPSLRLAEDKLTYLRPGVGGAADGVFQITTNITNLNKPNAAVLSEVTVAILVDDGLLPLDGGGNDITLPKPPTNREPYTVVLGNLQVGDTRQLVWNLRAQVLPQASYRKVVFRAYDTSGPEGPLVLDNLIGSATAYVLCPGGDGDLPPLTFTSIGPRAVYNQGTRHLFVTGSGLGTYLNGAFSYELVAYPKDGSSLEGYKIPQSNLIFPPDEPGVMEVVLEQEMLPGEYQLGINWQGGSAPFGEQSIRPPALSFLVTEDPAYRNDYYGIIVVVKGGTMSNPTYSIKAFANEQAFAAFGGSVLLEFRGKFTITSATADGAILACSAVASAAGDTVTVNGALDFERGNVQIYRMQTSKDGVMVEFNGDLYTSNSRTSVWSGNASLTPLTDGADFGLIKYNQRGERIFGKQPQNIISLVWPSGYNMLQTIGGFAVDFRYGQFGAMYKDNDAGERTGYVVSFGGKLDLSFLLPGGSKQAEELEDDDGTDASQNDDGSVTVSPSDQAKAENERNKVKPAGKVNIEDVLFGNGDGYLGFNSQAELMLPKYVQPLPAMGGKLAINTIGGYKVGVLGKVKTKKFELEFELKVQNHPNSNAPIPDKLYFYMAGFEPGVNVDGAGAFWLTGAGGGIDKLYDTIFQSGVPPLTVLLSASFDVVKVMSGRADLALSLRGFQMKLTDLKLKNTDKVIIKSGQLGVEWEPDFYLQLSAMAEILEIIEGRTYLVVDNDFFEMFLRASVKIPKDVKIIGDMTVGNVDLGGNHDKIWGTISALGIRLGVTYYWGGDVKFGSGANTTKPTYPELLGMPDVPVGTSAETGETLYLSVGANLSEGIPAQLVAADWQEQPELLALEPTLKSQLNKRIHSLNLGDSPDDAALTIRFAGVVAQAEALVEITDPLGRKYDLSYYDRANPNPNTANANLVVSEDGKSTTVNVTITDYVAGDWQIRTAAEADIVLYMVGSLPEVEFTDAYPYWFCVYTTWAGTGLEGAKLSFYLKDSVDIGADSPGIFVGSADAAQGSFSFAPPKDLPAGSYHLQAVLSKEDLINQSMLVKVGGKPYVYTKSNYSAPETPDGVRLANCGNGQFVLTVSNQPSSYYFRGYLVNIYEQSAGGLLPTDLMALQFEKDGSGILPQMQFGGSYLTLDGQSFGLPAGKTYLAEVSAYSQVGGDLYFSPAAWSAPVELRAATPPAFSFVPQTAHRVVNKTIQTADGEQTIGVPTFTGRDVQLTLTTETPVSGYWTIDGALAANAANPDSSKLNQVEAATSILVAQQLCDGEHVLSFTGTDAEGDGFVYSKLFAVDSMPPRLMLSSPVNGSTFAADGALFVQGIGDADSVYTVRVDGLTVASGLKLVTSADGLFSYQLSLDPGVVSHQVTVIAEDAVGHSVSATANVTNVGLADIERVDILLDGIALGDPASRNIGPAFLGKQVQLGLVATTKSGQELLISDQRLVQWTASAKTGSASVDSTGELLIAPGSVGYLVGELRVADGASLDSALTFGAENFSGAQRHLVVVAGAGGSAKGGGSYLPNAQVGLSATPAPGYRFAGWSSAGGGSFGHALAANTVFTMPDTDTMVIEVTAAFEVDPSTALTVSFETNGGSAVGSELVAPGGRATAPPAPSRAGHQFVEWCSDSALTVAFNFGAAITGNTTLYAKWQINKYTVTFVDWDGSELVTQEVAWHQAATPPAPSRAGYALVDWDCDFGSVESDLTVTAMYAPVYTVTFQVNGGTVIPAQIVVKNLPAVGPAWPSKAGYYFAGWYVDPKLTAPYDFSLPITADITLYARWFAEDEPERTVVSRFAQTADDRKLDEALSSGQAVLSLSGDDQAVLSVGVLRALFGARLPLTLVGRGVTLRFPPNWLGSADLSNQALVRISARQLEDAEQESLLAGGTAAGRQLYAVCGRVHELSVEVISRNAADGKGQFEVHQFLQPIEVKLDLGELDITPKQAPGLSGARLEWDAQGTFVPTLLGGTYDPTDSSFTFSTDQFSHYAVIESVAPRWVITLATGKPQALVNGEVVALDVPPVLINGRTMVPVRFLAETMGAAVSWSAASATVSIRLDGLELKLRIGEVVPESGLDVPAQLVEGRTLVPLRFILENFGATVTWSEQDGSVRIVKP